MTNSFISNITEYRDGRSDGVTSLVHTGFSDNLFFYSGFLLVHGFLNRIILPTALLNFTLFTRDVGPSLLVCLKLPALASAEDFVLQLWRLFPR